MYVHGYRDDVDSAFTNHRLAEQFAKSALDALFIAVAAPSGPGQPVMFGDLDELLRLVNAEGPVLVLGHSGGNHTMKAWLSSPRVREVVLLDGFYGGAKPWTKWLSSPRVREVVLLDGFYGDAKPWTKWLSSKTDATLRMVGQHTWAKAEAWRVGLPVALRAQVTHERAGCPHMEIVTNGDWLPRVLRESSLADTING